MAKADLRKPETGEWDANIGKVIEGLMLSQGWSLKEFADVLGRDERQVARWMTGKENPQLSVICAIACLRQPLVIGLAGLAGAGVELETVVRIRRTA